MICKILAAQTSAWFGVQSAYENLSHPNVRIGMFAAASLFSVMYA